MRRHALRLKQTDVARRMGLVADRHSSSVSAWESGIHGVTLTSLRLWAAALGMELTLRETGGAE